MKRALLLAPLAAASVLAGFLAWPKPSMPSQAYDLIMTVRCDGYDAYDDGEKLERAIKQAKKIADRTTPASSAAAASAEGASVLIKLTGKICLIDHSPSASEQNQPWLTIDWDHVPPYWHDFRDRAEFDAAQRRRKILGIDKLPDISSVQFNLPAWLP